MQCFGFPRFRRRWTHRSDILFPLAQHLLKVCNYFLIPFITGGTRGTQLNRSGLQVIHQLSINFWSPSRYQRGNCIIVLQLEIVHAGTYAIRFGSIVFIHMLLYFRLPYDGQSDLLFNLDNKNLFYYDLLINYLHHMVEGRNPLVAYLRASTHSCTSQSHTKGMHISLLRRAWYAFSQLLELDIENGFQCPLCGASPGTFICDGTMLGFRKDLLASTSSTPNVTDNVPLISGSKHEDCVLIKSAKCRELLLQFTGITRDRKKIRNPKQLTATELKFLCSGLRNDGFNSLSNLICRITSETNSRRCLEPYREFLSDI